MKKERTASLTEKMSGRRTEPWTENLVCLVNAHKPSNLHSWGPGMRDIYALHYILSGRGYLECNGRQFLLQQGDSFLIYPQMELYYYPDEQEPWEYVWVDFKGMEVESLLEHTAFSRDMPVWQGNGGIAKELQELFFIPETDGKEIYVKERAQAKLRLLLAYYMEHYPQRREEKRGDFVLLVKEYVDNRYWNSELCVGEIAAYLNLDRSALFRKFKQATGSSVKDYVMNCRMKRACQLLVSTNLSVKAVACSVGYPDQMYFARVFRQQIGCAPSEYRLAFLQEETPQP